MKNYMSFNRIYLPIFLATGLFMGSVFVCQSVQAEIVRVYAPVVTSYQYNMGYDGPYYGRFLEKGYRTGAVSHKAAYHRQVYRNKPVRR